MHPPEVVQTEFLAKTTGAAFANQSFVLNLLWVAVQDYREVKTPRLLVDMQLCIVPEAPYIQMSLSMPAAPYNQPLVTQFQNIWLHI